MERVRLFLLVVVLASFWSFAMWAFVGELRHNASLGVTGQD